jgi:hypothetical protein
MTSTPTPGALRIAKAQRTRMRAAEEKKAQLLRSRGWTCIPPQEDSGDGRAVAVASGR